MTASSLFNDADMKSTKIVQFEMLWVVFQIAFGGQFFDSTIQKTANHASKRQRLLGFQILSLDDIVQNYKGSSRL